MNATPYVEALAKALNMPVEMSDSGSVFFEWEDQALLLQWVEAEQSFVVYAELGQPSGWRDGELFSLLLSANFLLLEGGALSWNAGTNMVGINFSLPLYGLTPELFLEKFNAILNRASHWKEELRTMNAAQEKKVMAEQTRVLELEDIAFAVPANESEVPGPRMLRI